jgi:hypothetical protein
MNIVIQGRRWFQRTYGNTYHSATMLIDGKPVLSTGIHYGYGDQYQETALAQAAKENLIPERREGEPGWRWAERHGITLHSSAVDVARERDL